MTLATRLGRLGHMQAAILDLDVGVGGDDVDVVGRDPHAVFDLYNRHCGAGAQDMRHLAFAFRIEMQHHDEGAATVGRHGIEEMAKGFDATSRCADTDDFNLARVGNDQFAFVGVGALG
jgi:hypothetical protein